MNDTSAEDDVPNVGRTTESVISGDNWDEQMREIEEAEKWDKSAHRIPANLQSQFLLLFEKYSAARRVSIYKLMDIFDWGQ